MRLSAQFFSQGVAVACLAAGVARAAEGDGDGAAAAASGQGGRPIIHFAEKSFDCGRIAVGKTIQHDFLFTNRGTVPLVLSNVAASCGCTVAANWTRTVEPGKEGVVPVTFTVPPLNGVFSKALSVNSNDAATPVTTLQIQGTAWQPFEITPPTLIFGAVEGQPCGDPGKVKVTSRLDGLVTLSDPQCGIAGMTVKMKELVKGREFELTVTPGNDKAIPSNGVLMLKSSFEGIPTVSVPLVVSLMPAVVITPARLLVPDGPLKEAFRVHVMVRNNLSEPLRVDPEVTAPPGVTAEVRELEKGKLYSVEADLPVGWNASPKETPVLVFHTSHSNHARVEIPLVVAGGRMTPPPQPATPVASPGLAALRGRVEFAEITHDVGTVQAGKPVVYEFKFALRAGGGPLDIERVDACANKGKTRDWTRRVEPGQTGSVTLELDTVGLEGPVEVAFLVIAKGTAEPLAELRLKATIAKPAKTTGLSGES